MELVAFEPSPNATSIGLPLHLAFQNHFFRESLVDDYGNLFGQFFFLKTFDLQEKYFLRFWKLVPLKTKIDKLWRLSVSVFQNNKNIFLYVYSHFGMFGHLILDFVVCISVICSYDRNFQYLLYSNAENSNIELAVSKEI